MAGSKATAPATMDVQTPTAFQRLVREMSLAADIEDESNDSSVAINMVERILTTDDESEMWAADDLVQIGGRDLRDVEQRIMDVSIKFSNRDDITTPFKDENGRKMFLLVRAVKLENGEEIVWNTGAPSLVAKLMWLIDHGKLPAEVVIKGVDLGSGQAFLKLKPVPRRAVQQ